jgi:hypothetical protein
MKRAVAWALGLYLLCALAGRFVESMGVVRCACSGDCWCRQPGLSAFRWVFPYGHRLAIEGDLDQSSVDVGGAVAVSPDVPARPEPDTAVSPGVPAPPEPDTAVRYWLYKVKKTGAPGAGGDWEADVFSSAEPVEWGGHHSTRSAEVAKALNDVVSVGDVVVAYQTDAKVVVGYLRLVRIDGPRDARRLFLQPIHRIDPAFPIHEHKAGTSLAGSTAVSGSVMLRELSEQEMQDLVRVSGTPERVLRAEDPPGGRSS